MHCELSLPKVRQPARQTAASPSSQPGPCRKNRHNSERDIIPHGRGLLEGIAAAETLAAAQLSTPAARGARREHFHLPGDDLGGIAVIAVLVLPLAGLQLAFDVDPRPL